MKTPDIPQSPTYEDFVNDVLPIMSNYEAAVWPIITKLTQHDLKDRTTIHPDGFLKFYPFEMDPETAGDDGQVRVHIWLPEEDGLRGPHSHPFDLVSRVIAGTYAEVMPQVSQDETGNWSKHFVSYDGPSLKRADMGYLGDVSAEIGETTITTEGNEHYMPAGPYHASDRRVGSAGITLAVMSARREQRAHFLVPADRPPEPLAPLMPNDEQLDRAWRMLKSIKQTA